MIETFRSLLCAAPYLIPLDQPQVEVSPDDPVGEHGPFPDINGASIYVEEKNPDLFDNMVLPSCSPTGIGTPGTQPVNRGNLTDMVPLEFSRRP